jgi:hypothetical protein
MNRFVSASAFLVAVVLAQPTEGAPITFSASEGNLAASATFDAIGNDLVVTLTNTSTSDVLVPADLLTAVFFTMGGGPPALTPASAMLGLGSTVLFGGTDPGNVVGGEWAYGSGLSNAPEAATHGISSSGLNLFGSANFPGSNLQGPDGVNGLQYGITSFGDDPLTGNSVVTGDNALIKDQVVFVLSGLPNGFDPSVEISSVSFQYGTSLSEPNIGTPEPATCGWLAFAYLLVVRRPRFAETSRPLA